MMAERIYYTYQCNRCFIISGHSGDSPEDAPLCCGGEEMRAIKHIVKTAIEMDEKQLIEQQCSKCESWEAGRRVCIYFGKDGGDSAPIAKCVCFNPKPTPTLREHQLIDDLARGAWRIRTGSSMESDYFDRMTDEWKDEYRCHAKLLIPAVVAWLEEPCKNKQHIADTTAFRGAPRRNCTDCIAELEAL